MDLWLVSLEISCVLHDLTATIWKQHVVRAPCVFILAVLLVTEFAARLRIAYFVREFVVGWFL
jgi:hypothetical protein